MVHRREIGGEPVVFGNQGALWGNAMTWWDHDTGSVWSQPLGEAILGPLTGERLELMASTLTTWEDWKSSHPDTAALAVDGWASGFHLEDMAIVVDLGAEAVAYDVSAVRRAGVVEDVVAGFDIAVVVDGDRWAVFSREVGESRVDLEMTASGLLDTASGTVFHPFLGSAIEGPLGGSVLTRLPAFTVFPADFVTFFPEGRRWSG